MALCTAGNRANWTVCRDRHTGNWQDFILGLYGCILAAERKYHIVVQHEGMWWSRQVGGKTTAHYKEEPVELLQNPTLCC